MSCSCKHSQQQIKEDMDTLKVFRELFIKRMSHKSETTDRRKRDFNCPIFFWNEYAGEHSAVFSDTSMEMVLDKFDQAVKDYRRVFCDTEDCSRK